MVERFLNYVTIDTRSQDDTGTIPTTKGQWDLARVLVSELQDMGLKDVLLTEHCFVHATLPANCSGTAPVIGFMAHLDTYPGFAGHGVSPKIHENYDGGTIVLDEATGCHLNPSDFPELLRYKGHDIITTDGKTLLGADDKAGIAEIMEAISVLIEHPEIPHGEIRVAFTPDEETDAGGLSALDRNIFDVDFVVTVDGDGLGEVNFENFNAAHAEVHFTGLSVHTGEAKDRMRNATVMANEWISMLPKEEFPENSSGYEGFYHIEEFNGKVDEARIYCLIRDFEEKGFEQRKEKLREITRSIEENYGFGTVRMQLKDDYFNMKKMIEGNPALIGGILESCRNAGIEPTILPIRGGTDGAMLAEMGIAAPNIFLGGHNYHGQYEFISVQAMEAASRIIVEISSHFATIDYNEAQRIS